MLLNKSQNEFYLKGIVQGNEKTYNSMKEQRIIKLECNKQFAHDETT